MHEIPSSEDSDLGDSESGSSDSNSEESSGQIKDDEVYFPLMPLYTSTHTGTKSVSSHPGKSSKTIGTSTSRQQAVGGRSLQYCR